MNGFSKIDYFDIDKEGVAYKTFKTFANDYPASIKSIRFLSGQFKFSPFGYKLKVFGQKSL